DALGGHLGALRDHNPRSALKVRATETGVHVAGRAFDRDALDRHVRYAAYLDDALVRTARAAAPSPGLDEAYRITGDHGHVFHLAAEPGAHQVCLVFANVGAGTADPRQCITTA